CEFCMPEAFCGIETLVEKLCYICGLCERKKYPLLEKKILLVREKPPSMRKRNTLCERER
ncbi:hypothetical protein, partial [Prevotella jejuni]|uniref:hypothetical protein n=1 Tax=Prevotella jejuni TaxID=1177574 RepID=UPI003211AD6F